MRTKTTPRPIGTQPGFIIISSSADPGLFAARGLNAPSAPMLRGLPELELRRERKAQPCLPQGLPCRTASSSSTREPSERSGQSLGSSVSFGESGSAHVSSVPDRAVGGLEGGFSGLSVSGGSEARSQGQKKTSSPTSYENYSGWCECLCGA